MRTFLAGFESLRRRPAAVLPLTAVGAVGAIAIWLGAMPPGGSGAAATAAFPLGVFFDLKQAIAAAPSWPVFFGVVALSAVARGLVLGGTLWLSVEPPERDEPLGVAGRAIALSATGAAALFPGASLFYVGTVTRYMPFVAVAALVSIFPAAWLLRRAVGSYAGGPVPKHEGLPGVSQLLGYGALVAAQGALMSVLLARSPALAGMFVLLMGPAHALFLLGTRELSLRGTVRGKAVAIAVAVAVGLLLSDVLLDRTLRDPGPAARTDARGELLLLSGADSTSEKGSLFGFDPRSVGYPLGSARLLSYRGAGDPYTGADTRVDLRRVAASIGQQLAEVRGPRVLLGHSQASPIVDRLVADNLPLPEAAAVISPSPSYPSPIDIPPPDVIAQGKVGGDIARAFARMLEAAGAAPFDIDASASPTNLDDVVIPESPLPRLSVWALTDSVWLSGDWRHRDHVNVIALSDHVGALNDPATIGAVREFFAGERIEGDGSGLKSVLATTLRYAFEPWRPR